MAIKETNEKFVKGKEGLTDGELIDLMNLYRGLIEIMSDLDSDFALCKKELNRRYSELKGFDDARKELNRRCSG